MRGMQYFPRNDEREWARSYDRNYIAWQGREIRNGRSFEERPTTEDEWQAIYTSTCNSGDYNDWRQGRDRLAEGERVLWKGVSELDLNGLEEKPFDRPRLAPFKLKYDTLDEVRMRFNKTVILVKGHPFHVSDQRHVGEAFYLLLENVNKTKSYIPVDEIPDLRPAPPGYVKIGETNGYFKRLPVRVNQQGMTSQSTQIRRVGNQDSIPFNSPSLVEALDCRGKVLPWEKAYRTLIDDRIVSTFRLSDQIALYRKPQQVQVLVEYKGRRLGTLDDHTVHLFDEDDGIQPWLKRDANKVNLEIAS